MHVCWRVDFRDDHAPECALQRNLWVAAPKAVRPSIARTHKHSRCSTNDYCHPIPSASLHRASALLLSVIWLRSFSVFLPLFSFLLQIHFLCACRLFHVHRIHNTRLFFRNWRLFVCGIARSSSHFSRPRSRRTVKFSWSFTAWSSQSLFLHRLGHSVCSRTVYVECQRCMPTLCSAYRWRKIRQLIERTSDRISNAWHKRNSLWTRNTQTLAHIPYALIHYIRCACVFCI